MGVLNSHHRYVIQCVVAFIAGSQLVHYFMKPLADINELTAEKKSQLWRDYLKEREARK